MPKIRVLLNNGLESFKAVGLIFSYVNIDTLKSILAYFQITDSSTGSRILGYTEWAKWSFMTFS